MERILTYSGGTAIREFRRDLYSVLDWGLMKRLTMARAAIMATYAVARDWVRGNGSVSRRGSRVRDPSPTSRAEKVAPNVLLENVDFSRGAYNIFSQIPTTLIDSVLVAVLEVIIHRQNALIHCRDSSTTLSIVFFF